MGKVLAIDPGNIESAYCIVDVETYKPIEFGKVMNDQLQERLRYGDLTDVKDFVIEKVASYGMPVGREVFDTCEQIGRFDQIIFDRCGKSPHYVFRIDEKLAICHDTRASDTNIRRALIDRFATHDLKNGKGTKKNPDWFYGFKADVWAAYSVAITYIEKW